MKLSVEILKQESCNFDLECVFVLDLTKKGINDLDHINDCINLEILNLSLNELTDLTSLRGLSKLQYVNLSLNQIKHLDGLESLENLKTLNLSGNSIDNVDEFYKLKNLENLTHLILYDAKTSASNPVCNKNKNYKTDINKILPKLEVIDGESFKTSNKNLFKSFDDTLNNLKNSISNDDLDLSSCSQPWFDKNVSAPVNQKSILKNQNSIEEEREKFKKLYEEISKSIQTQTTITSKIESSLKAINTE